MHMGFKNNKDNFYALLVVLREIAVKYLDIPFDIIISCVILGGNSLLK